MEGPPFLVHISINENYSTNALVDTGCLTYGMIRLAASGRVIEVGPGSRPAKTRFGSGFLTRVFESG